MAGQEVVQLYVSPKTCSVQRPLKELKGFVKVDLASGQTKLSQFGLTGGRFNFIIPIRNNGLQNRVILKSCWALHQGI